MKTNKTLTCVHGSSTTCNGWRPLSLTGAFHSVKCKNVHQHNEWQIFFLINENNSTYKNSFQWQKHVIVCCVQICRKICGLGCVNHALVRALFTQPSPRICCISVYNCRKGDNRQNTHRSFCDKEDAAMWNEYLLSTCRIFRQERKFLHDWSN